MELSKYLDMFWWIVVTQENIVKLNCAKLIELICSTNTYSYLYIYVQWINTFIYVSGHWKILAYSLFCLLTMSCIRYCMMLLRDILYSLTFLGTFHFLAWFELLYESKFLSSSSFPSKLFHSDHLGC